MKTINFGIVGCGLISRVHSKAIEQAGGTLLGACSRTFESARNFAQETGCKAYSSYDEMLGDSSIDVVSICSPTGEHYQQAKQALLAGKHVVIEKPMSLKLSECDELIKLADERKLLITVISQSRFSNAAVAIKKTVESGVCGKPVSTQLLMRYTRTQEYYDSASWRGTFAYDGGGVLMNQGIHGIDLMCYLFGQPKSVSGMVKTILRKIEVEDTAVAAVEFKNGALGVIDSTTCSNPAFTKTFIFAFENGTIVLENDVITKWTVPSPLPEGTDSSLAGLTVKDNKAVTDVYHTRQYQNFIKAMNGEESLVVDGNEGRMPLSVILGTYESSKTGRRIEL